MGTTMSVYNIYKIRCLDFRSELMELRSKILIFHVVPVSGKHLIYNNQQQPNFSA